MLRDRFAGATQVSPVTVLGPLAVNARAAGCPGLLLAGDAAGFVDPMTGDGLRFALRGGELAAQAALDELASGQPAFARLGVQRRREFQVKWRINRALRMMVGSPRALEIAAVASAWWSSPVEYLIRLAGDVSLARTAGRERAAPQLAVPAVALLAVLVMMLAELWLSASNERVLRAHGAIEADDPVFVMMRLAYPGVFVAMALEGAVTGVELGPMTFAGVSLMFAAKALKFWAIASLGSRWTYKVLVVPGLPLVTTGPYRWFRHPNYVGVVGELIAMALMTRARRDRSARHAVLRVAAVPADGRGRAGDGTILTDQ